MTLMPTKSESLRPTKLCLGTAAAIFITFCSPAVYADEPETPPSNLVLCVACHGENGIATSEQWPHLAAQSSQYLAEQSIRYRDGLRYDPNGLMVPWVKNLSDETIGAIAEYYSRQAPAPPSKTVPGDVENGRRLAEACAGCHRLDGSSISEVWPDLAAQDAGYFDLSMQYYQQGLRQDEVGLMASFSQGLTSKEIIDLASHYASLDAAAREPETP